MMDCLFDVKNIMLSLIRKGITNTPISLPFNINTIMNSIDELYSLANRHDVAHLVFISAINCKLIDTNSEYSSKIDKVVFAAIARYNQQNHELNRIRLCFQSEHIRFIPLKGSVIRDYYPEPWMRTSCDIDILVREEDLKKARDLLISLGYNTDGHRNYHDVSFLKGSVHVELHFNILEGNGYLDKVLKDIWENVYSFDKFELRENNTFFMFHNIAHTAYHFLSGGCGVRPIIDLWLLINKLDYNKKQLDAYLQKSKLSVFYKSIRSLSKVWFEGEAHSDITFKMEDYILKNGSYGTSKSCAAA